MAEMTREEVTARLETIDVRLEGHVKVIETLIGGMSSSLKDMKDGLHCFVFF